MGHGAQSATVAEVGATLREYSDGEGPILDGFAVDEPAGGGRGQPLLPWPNRIRDGKYTFDAAVQQLPINEVERQNAIHGLTRWRNWTPVELKPSSVVLMLLLHPQPGYPYSLLLSIAYELSDTGLCVTTTARNAGRERLPFGAGFHPYVYAGGGLVDDLTLAVPSTRMLVFDDRQLPTAARADVRGTKHDFSSPRRVGGVQLDACYCDLERDGGGVASVRAGTVEVWMDAAFDFLMVFSGDALPDRERRRRGLALEPMTCPPDAFNSGTGVVVLEPGGRFSARWGLGRKRN